MNIVTFGLSLLVGWMLADHYKSNKPGTLLCSVIFGWLFTWVWLYLVKNQKATGAIATIFTGMLFIIYMLTLFVVLPEATNLVVNG